MDVIQLSVISPLLKLLDSVRNQSGKDSGPDPLNFGRRDQHRMEFVLASGSNQEIKFGHEGIGTGVKDAAKLYHLPSWESQT